MSSFAAHIYGSLVHTRSPLPLASCSARLRGLSELMEEMAAPAIMVEYSFHEMDIRIALDIRSGRYAENI